MLLHLPQKLIHGDGKILIRQPKMYYLQNKKKNKKKTKGTFEMQWFFHSKNSKNALKEIFFPTGLEKVFQNSLDFIAIIFKMACVLDMCKYTCSFQC